MKRRIAILFDNFGPYHLARLQAASTVCDLLSVEFGASSDDYPWERERSRSFPSVTLNPSGPSSRMKGGDFEDSLDHTLQSFSPEVVFIPGWGSRFALRSLRWCLDQGVPAVVMSESTRWDAPRSYAQEWVKGRILSLYSAALVGGTSHAEYLGMLGFPAELVFTGYDAVDNAFFACQRDREVSGASVALGQARPYVLASARFVPKKNLPLLLKAYAGYRTSSSKEGVEPWDLVLLGDGPLRCELENLRDDLGLLDCVRMPGFVQYPDLPSWYAGACAFVHVSTVEPWGLVVNEAMASSLPLLVSNRCGCARDLVKEGVNGWTFDPSDQEALAARFLELSSQPDKGISMGKESHDVITEWGTERFAKGVLTASYAAYRSGSPTAGFLCRTLLELLIRRLDR